jgi:hypothetical protein
LASAPVTSGPLKLGGPKAVWNLQTLPGMVITLIFGARSRHLGGDKSIGERPMRSEGLLRQRV